MENPLLMAIFNSYVKLPEGRKPSIFEERESPWILVKEDLRNLRSGFPRHEKPCEPTWRHKVHSREHKSGAGIHEGF